MWIILKESCGNRVLKNELMVAKWPGRVETSESSRDFAHESLIWFQ